LVLQILGSFQFSLNLLVDVRVVHKWAKLKNTAEAFFLN